MIFKKIDRLLIKSFIPPFVLAFFIAIFVLVMQFLWNFIDEIIGKGISTIDLFELLFYRSLSLFPLAIPIGVLLSSVMVFGNFSEKYELSSLKSAGVSLLRTMAPIIALGVGIALFSVFCSNTLIPLSNLKFQSRLYDIRNQKPALSLEEGVFNDDFQGFTIRIGKKHLDNRHIEDILVYDQTSSARRQFNVITAQRGEMYVTEDGRDFVMKLYDGNQYQELQQTQREGGHPFTKTKFNEWTKQFDLSEFEMGHTDEELFKSHHSMKSVRQLLFEIDTIDVQYNETRARSLYDFTHILSNRESLDFLTKDTMHAKYGNNNAQRLDGPSRIRDSVIIITADSAGVKQNNKGTKFIPKVNRRNFALAMILDTLTTTDWSSVFVAFPSVTKKQYIRQAVTRAKSLRDNQRRMIASLEMIRINRAMHIFELHWKFSIAAICVIFLFIGAPMGAIVRKGGYGYPLIVAIVFFTLFIILNLMFKKLAETEAIDPTLGAWAPCLILLPLSAVLTYRAMNDSKVLDVSRFVKWFSRDHQKAEGA